MGPGAVSAMACVTSARVTPEGTSSSTKPTYDPGSRKFRLERSEAKADPEGLVVDCDSNDAFMFVFEARRGFDDATRRTGSTSFKGLTSVDCLCRTRDSENVARWVKGGRRSAGGRAGSEKAHELLILPLGVFPWLRPASSTPEALRVAMADPAWFPDSEMFAERRCGCGCALSTVEELCFDVETGMQKGFGS